jgi:hypothetical protein
MSASGRIASKRRRASDKRLVFRGLKDEVAANEFWKTDPADPSALAAQSPD